MEINLSLADLFLQTFGYPSAAFDPGFAPVTGDIPANRIQTGQLGAPYYGFDAAGREVFLPVSITYPASPSPGIPQPATDAPTTTWTLPYCVVAVNGKRNIVETPLTERNGTVKELISRADYEITIKGFLIASGNDFPEADATRLRNLFEASVPVSISCALTDLFLLRPDRSGSDQVVFRALAFPEVRGIKNVRPFELQCVSDEPFNLQDIT